MRSAIALFFALLLAASTIGGASAAGPSAAVTFDAQRAHVHAAGASGRLLAAAAAATATGLVKAYLQAHGKSAATVDSLRLAVEFRNLGVTHAFFTQQVGGLRVAGAYVRAAVNARGDLIHVVENIADVGAAVAATRVTPAQALNAALKKVHPGLADRPAVQGRAGNVTTFRSTAAFATGPKAERVLIARVNGALEQGFSVETWTRRGNALHTTLIDRNGAAVAVESRTASDSYKVFTEDPLKTPQTIVAGPGSGNAQSPAGWLGSGAQASIHISGNNVDAYLDRNSDNKADAGGSAVTNGNFVSTGDLTQAPTTTANQAVAVQNLFYLNNVLHDILYTHGFTEAVGNFQITNFTSTGRGGDPVLAEAQDGGGTDNANFSTPPDGRSGRMQMYLWTGAGSTHEVVAGAATYAAAPAEFGTPLTTTGVSGTITLANDGVAPTSDGCEPMARGSLSGAIALVDRGTCTFVVKAQNAQTAGAVGLIVANNAPGEPVVMGGTAGGLKIGAVMISQADGTALKAAVPTAGTIRLKAVQPRQLDGDLDSDIVYHEYGHGLTWRMIGGMSGPLAGAIGEGASDGLAMLINGDDRMGEYSSSNPLGIRRAPYDNYPLTYGDVTGAEVHDDGEIYAAVVWRLMEAYDKSGRVDGSDLFDTWVDGFNYTPVTPAYEDMRDGMLASAAARNATAETCLIWDAFAAQGIGVGADGTATNKGVSITESFTKPASCH